MDVITKSRLIVAAGFILVLLVCFLMFRFRAAYDRKGAGGAATPAPAQTTSIYQQFRNDYIDSAGNFNAWHDGLNPRFFEQMTPDDRARAEADMLRALPDWRCIIGLGFMRSQKAIEPLRRLEKQLHGEQIVRVEQALQRIGVAGEGVPGARTRQVLTGEDSGSNKISRMDAAIALREFPSSETAIVLRRALETDDDYLVRYHSANSLLIVSGYGEAEADGLIAALAPKLGYEKSQAFPEALERIDSLVAARRAAPGSDGSA